MFTAFFSFQESRTRDGTSITELLNLSFLQMAEVYVYVCVYMCVHRYTKLIDVHFSPFIQIVLIPPSQL